MGDKLLSCVGSTQDQINPYIEKNQVIVYAAETTRLHVGINETLSSKEKTTVIKEIYHFIDEEARKQNITDIPVYFDEGTFINQTGAKDLGVVENSSYSDFEFNNENVSNLNSSSGSESNKNKSAPGFGLLGSLTCLYGGWKLRKK
ncbi:MAG: hypothetical protein NHB15_13730 [Methanosarcina barkeri]|nr:hypothetical protein [Methanosarcina sp. ERenArc_MAG2]